MKNVDSVVLFVFLLAALGVIAQSAPEKFNCDGSFYFSFGNVNQNGGVYMGVYDTNSATLTDTISSTTSFNHNALAFNYKNNYIYAVANPTREFYRIDQSGNYLSLGFVTGFNPSKNIYAGDFDEHGILVLAGNVIDGMVYRIDMNASIPVLLTSVQLSYLDTSTKTPNFSDIAYNRLDSTFYGLDVSKGIIHVIDPITGVVTPVSTNLAGPRMLGALFFNSDFTKLYGHGQTSSSTTTSELFRCDIATGICQSVTVGQDAYGNADGCSCHSIETSDSTVSDPTSISEFEDQSEKHFSIFPNPSTSGYFEIVSKSDVLSGYAIYSMDGKLIRQESTSETTVKVQNMANDMYMIHVFGSGSTPELFKLVVGD